MTQATPNDIHRVATAHGPMWVFKTDVYVSRSLTVYGEYCAAETEVFRQLIQPGMTVVEAGANIGSHSVFLAKACAPGDFYAFEPQQRVFQLLCANLTINGVTNARAYPEALGEAAGVAALNIPDYARTGNFGAATLTPASHGTPDHTLQVRVSTLDDWALPSCHLIKIDVEGWELQVLQGAHATIAKHRPILYVENDRKAHQATLIALIASLNYRLYWHVAMLFRPNNFNSIA